MVFETITIGWFPILLFGLAAFFVIAKIARTIQLSKKNNGMDMFGNIDTMTGEEFETMLAFLLRHKGYGVERTPKTGDYGCDLILYKDNVKTGVQAKRSKSKVGNASVMQAQSGATYYGCNYAWVMTNNNYTPQGIRQANKCGVSLYARKEIFKLQDDVKKMIKNEEKRVKKLEKKGEYLEPAKVEKPAVEEIVVEKPEEKPEEKPLKYGIITGNDRHQNCIPVVEKEYLEEYEEEPTQKQDADETLDLDNITPALSIYEAAKIESKLAI